jgi:hypothetical protein
LDDWLRFLNRDTNVYRIGDFVIGREVAKNSDCIMVSKGDKVAFTFWVKRDAHGKSDNPKHTGGRPAYAMFMLAEIEKMKDVSLDACGFLVKLSPNVQWNTGILADKRKKTPLTIGEMAKLTGIGRNKASGIISELKKNGILRLKDDGYCVSEKLLRKGGRKTGVPRKDPADT